MKQHSRAGSKRIAVDLTRQKLTAYDGTKPVFEFHCACGDKDNPTPTGRFLIYKKDLKHWSRKYNNVPMHHAMFFKDGYAIHEAHMVTMTSFLKTWGADSLGSHGCVRLSVGDATTLFDWAPIGTPVEING